MKRYLLFLLCSFCLMNCFSQSRYKVWCFGQNAGLDFNTTPPTPLTNSAINQLEGCASICDNSGQLLFYGDGITVWNRNHSIMLNGTGLLGDWSSTQSALIIPKPSDNNIFYIFTVPTNASIPLSYSVIDITLDGGLGGITTKNVALHVPVFEKLTGTLKSNGTDYWVITKEAGTDAFYTYSVTSAGVDPNPVITHTGIIPPDSFDTQGWGRVSPDGSKFCIGYMFSGLAQLFDFDNNTGMLSNPIDLVISTVSFHGPYGIEFSGDNSKLYLMQELDGIIRQYDLLAGSPTAIQNSVVQISALGPGTYGGAMVRGPDDKIYVSNSYMNNMSVINQPDLAGAACDYVSLGVQLPAGTSNRLGLPNNINFPAIPVCPLALHVSNNVSICANQHYQLPWGTVVSTSGMYSDTLKSHASCDSIINNIQVFVNDTSTTNIVDSIFAGDIYILPSGVTVSSAGVYQSVLLNSTGCDSVITTTLKLRTPIAACLTLRNAFTPNGDGVNDYWVLYRYTCFKNMEVNVYNRYGSLVYHSDDYKNDWMGTYKNKPVPDGTYYYVIKLISFNGTAQVFKDNVTILR